MANRYLKRLFQDIYHAKNLISEQDKHRRFLYGVVKISQSQESLARHYNTDSNSKPSNYCSSDDDITDSKWRIELAWLTKALEPALQLCRRALPAGNWIGDKIPPSGRSLSEIIASIQRSKIGIEVAKNSMLRQSNILKFVRDSSVMRPGYYIGIEPRKKLVILGIRGTQTVYDLITDIISSSDGEVTSEGFSTHFGNAEAARWFLNHEMETIRKCLEKHKGFRLRLVGHSLGGATASLLAVMLRDKSSKELGFSPDIVSAVGYATPPCVSRELAESCSDYVTTVVMQDDVIPRLSVASLARLRNEILQTDWMSVVEKDDWKRVIGLVTNAKQVVTSVQDVARKLADYAQFRDKANVADLRITEESQTLHVVTPKTSAVIPEEERTASAVPELFIPGTVYYLKRNFDTDVGNSSERSMEYFTLWKRHPSEHFQRIVLSGNIISDHKCDSHYHALRDVIKGIPGPVEEFIFR